MSITGRRLWYEGVVPEEPDIFERIAELRRQGRRAALVTVVETRGSTPRKAGARMLVLEDGSSEGTVGGGAVEHVLHEAAARVLEREEPELIQYDLTADLEMGCGGGMALFVEPVVGKPRLIMFGCGHVGYAVIKAAAPLGFDIIAVDDLAANTTDEKMVGVSRVVRSYEIPALEDLPFGDNTFVVIATREHAYDQRLVELCLGRRTRYLGVIGSVRKAKKQRQRLAEAGANPGAIARVHCPIGVDIGAQTPEEIAIAICAELVSVRRGGAHWEKPERE